MKHRISLRPQEIVVESLEVHELDYLVTADEVGNINEGTCTCQCSVTCHWLACALSLECGPVPEGAAE
ncbi:MAG TPA: hypothetical protein VF092_01555 [Longimicrobium sp.]